MKNRSLLHRLPIWFACLMLPVAAHAAAFPYITLNKHTNQLSDNGTALTFNGSAIGGANWVASGTTNSTLAGMASAGAVVATNSMTLAGATITNWSWAQTPTSLQSVFPPPNSTPNQIVQISTNTTGPWGNSANIYLGIDNDSSSGTTASGSIVGLGDWSISSSTLNNVTRFLAIGDSSAYGSIFDHCSRVVLVGPGSGSNGFFTNANSILAFGDDVMNGTTVNRADYLIGLGADTLSAANFTDCYGITGINASSLYGVTLSNSTNVNSLGVFNAWPTYPSGSAFSGTWTNVTMLGGYTSATNSNDFIVGNQWHNYFFPGASFTANNGLKTGAPSGGTAAAWKLGSWKTNAVTVIATNYIEVEIGGVLRKLAVVQ